MVLKSLMRLFAAVVVVAASLGSPMAAQKMSSPDSIAKASGPLGFRVHYVAGERYPVIDSILPGSWADLGHIRVGDSLVAVINMVENMSNAGYPNYDWINGGLFAMLVRRDERLISIGLSGIENTGSGGGGAGSVGGGAQVARGPGPRAPNQPVVPSPTPTSPAKAAIRRDATLVVDSLVKAAVKRGPLPGTQPVPLLSKKVGTATVEL